MVLKPKNGPTWEAVFDYVPADTLRIVGIDEVGRGAWAGPVVAAAVILPSGTILAGLNDSKLVTAARRTTLDVEIRTVALSVGVGWVSAGEVDKNGLSWAVKVSGIRALKDLAIGYDVILLDGTTNYLHPSYNSQAIVKADSLMVPVAAASIIAKVARDRWMEELAIDIPQYGFEKHKGYGTALHIDSLKKNGITSQHRVSYKPLKKYL